MRARLSVVGTPVLGALAGFAILVVACASSTDDASALSEPDAAEIDSGGGAKAEPDAKPESDAEAEPKPDGGSTDAEADADADAAVQTITVSGRVVRADGEPLAGVGVSVAGMPIVQTGLDGAFTFAGVTAPYHVTVIGDMEGMPLAHTFVDLSTATPRIVPLTELFASEPAKLQATVRGYIGPVPVGEEARVCIEGVDRDVYGCTGVNQGSNSYSLTAEWTSAASVPVRVRVLRFVSNAQRAIVDYTAAGSADALLSPGALHTVDVTLGAAPGKGTVTATVSVPTGGKNGKTTMFVKLGPWLNFPLEEVPVAPSSSFVVPVLAGASYSVLGSADVDGQPTYGWQAGLAAGATANPKLALPPTLTSPAEGATGVTNATKFVADNPAEIPITLLCLPEAESTAMFAVSTTSSSVNLPDLGAIGMPLPSGAPMGCALLAGGSLGAGPDALVTGDGPIGAILNMRRGLPVNGGLVFGATGSIAPADFSMRTVTTQ